MVHHEPEEPLAIHLRWSHRQILKWHLEHDGLSMPLKCLLARILSEEVNDANVEQLSLVLEPVFASQSLKKVIIRFVIILVLEEGHLVFITVFASDIGLHDFICGLDGDFLVDVSWNSGDALAKLWP